MPRAPRGKQVRDTDGHVVSVRAKAANGEGSVYAVEGGARWRATWHDGPTRRYVSAPTREKAIAKRAEAMARPTRSGGFGKTTTVGELATWWLDNLARHRVRPSSLGRYRDRVKRLGPELSATRVTALRPETVTEWQTRLLDEGLAPKTVSDLRVLLRQVIATAVDVGLVGANVVDRARPPKVTPKRPRRALTVDESRGLITAADLDRYAAAVAILFVQGWRISEVLGLAWADVDLDAGVATVRRALVHDGQALRLGPPKTAGALGHHQLAPGIVTRLRARRAAQITERLAAGAAWQTHHYDGAPLELIFTNHTGGLVQRQAITRAITTAAIAAGLEPTGLATHTGRRSVVTALYGTEGLDLADVGRYVGHASPATTALYVRGLGTRPQNTADAAARRLDVQ